MNTIDCILERHCYRGAYSSEPVPRENLRKILEAGLAAPSGCNKQTTSLIGVDDPEVVARIKEVVDLPTAKDVPAFICILSQRIIAYRDRCFALQDYAAAIENMMLALVDLGYQSCWYEGHITGPEDINDRLREILAIPEGYDLVCIMPVGKALEAVTAHEKKPFEERAWFNRFGNTD